MNVVSEDKRSYSVKPVPGAGSEEKHGISVGVAALFLLGSLAGAGVMAMPNAFTKAGLFAIPLCVIMCVAGCYTGMQLGWAWTILQETWSEYAINHTRNPYPEIAYRAGGNLLKYCVQACVHFSMFGGSVAFMILASNSICHLLDDWFGISINFCHMVVIVAVFMLPLFFLGTPKDFWLIALGAIAATVLAIILIIIGTVIDMDACKNKVSYPDVTLSGFISAYCTMSFAYGAHGAFPTIQHDMKKPEKFPRSVIFSYIILFTMYLPMPVLAYWTYGHTVQGTINMNLSSKLIRDSIMVLITCHLLFAFFIVMSPVNQDFERVLRIPVHFSWKRVCSRTFMLALATFIALSLPDFNAVLELVGGTSMAAVVYIFPGPVYLILRKKTHSSQQDLKLETNGKGENKSESSTVRNHKTRNEGQIAAWEYVVNGLIVVAGVVGAVVTIYGVFENGANLMKPCYLTGMHNVPHTTGGGVGNLTHCWQKENDTSLYIMHSAH